MSPVRRAMVPKVRSNASKAVQKAHTADGDVSAAVREAEPQPAGMPPREELGQPVEEVPTLTFTRRHHW